MATIFGSNKTLLSILAMVESYSNNEHNLKNLVCFDNPSKDLFNLANELGLNIYDYHHLLMLPELGPYEN